MAVKTPSKLNQLYRLVPEGAVAPLAWLQEQGYSRQLVSGYVKSGWLEALGAGGYYRPGTLLEWEGIVYSLQTLCGLPLHVGSLTALQHQGYAHVLPLGTRPEIRLVSDARVRAPAWLDRLPMDVTFELSAKKLFGAEPSDETLVDLPWRKDGKGVRAAAAERAVLEMLADVPKKHGFEQAAQVMEGLTRLRPKVMESLLTQCHHVKVKRLFLFLAKHYQHRWLDGMDLSGVSLGSGKRVVVEGGRLDNEFDITIPKSFAT